MVGYVVVIDRIRRARSGPCSAYGQTIARRSRGSHADGERRQGCATHKLSPLYHVLLALVSILLLGRWLGKLFVHFGQPRVIGEMVAGIMLGPSLLGSDLAGSAALHPARRMSRRILESSPRSA